MRAPFRRCVFVCVFATQMRYWLCHHSPLSCDVRPGTSFHWTAEKQTMKEEPTPIHIKPGYNISTVCSRARNKATHTQSPKTRNARDKIRHRARMSTQSERDATKLRRYARIARAKCPRMLRTRDAAGCYCLQQPRPMWCTMYAVMTMTTMVCCCCRCRGEKGSAPRIVFGGACAHNSTCIGCNDFALHRRSNTTRIARIWKPHKHIYVYIHKLSHADHITSCKTWKYITLHTHVQRS